MTMLVVNGAQIAYDEAGSGPAVLLVHGAGADRRLWEHQFHALRHTHRVIRYDWRGYGESGDATGDFCHAEDLVAVMDALGVHSATLVGSSMGGSRAVEAALLAPGRVEGLVLICSGLAGHTWPQRMIDQARERVHSSVDAARLAAYRDRSAAPTAADVEAYAAAHVLWQVAGPARSRADLSEQVWREANEMARLVFQRLWTAPPAAEREIAADRRLGEITAPTLVINGLADVPDIQAVSDLLSAGIAGARRIDLPGTAHLPPLERPEEVTSALMAFASIASAR